MRTHEEHELSPGTHTVELQQIAEINDRLRPDGARLTAGAIGFTGVTGVGSKPEVAEARAAHALWLLRVRLEGSPSFPWVYGEFAPNPGQPPLRTLLHTPHLRAISSALGLHHHWGA
jgi:hypothetical protein